MLKTNKTSGFTIVELLVVVIVIAILATVSFVAYSGMQRSAAESILKSDLRSASRQLDLINAGQGAYPENVNSIASSEDTTLEYTSDGSTFCLTASSERAGTAFHVTEGNEIADGPCDGHEGVGEGSAINYTSSSCFAFSAGNITNYYDYENDDDSSPACPRAVNIPNDIGGVEVASLGVSSFQNRSITSVTIPNSVTSIGNGAFWSNQLTSVTIPDSVISIGSSAFSLNQLVGDIVFPNSVTSIGAQSFALNQLTSVTIPNSVTFIGADAFNGNQLTSVTIPSSVTTIRVRTFRNNQLTSVTIPSSVTTIGDFAFHGNQLTSVTISSSATVDTNTFDSGVTINYY